MWTDGRYYIQAEKQLEAGWEMMKMEAGQTMWFEHIKNTLQEGQVLGIDFTQYPASALQARVEYFKKSNIEVKSVPNLVDIVWGDERPARPANPAKTLDIKFAGKTSLEKQEQIAQKLKDKEYEAFLVTTLDDICWLTNLRGTDIDYNPVFFAYGLFYPKRPAEEARFVLFMNPSAEVDREYLAS